MNVAGCSKQPSPRPPPRPLRKSRSSKVALFSAEAVAMGDTTQASPPGSNPSPEAAAAAAVTPDAVTAEILRKHTGGEKLTPREGGILGAFRRKLKAATGGPANPFGAAPSPAASPVAVPAAASADSLPPVPVDSSLARRTAGSILRRCDAATVRYLEGQARAAQLGAEKVADVAGKARLPMDDQALICDLAPDICAELGIDPRKSPLLVAGAVLTAHVFTLGMLVMELRELREATQPKPAPKPPVTDRGTPAPGPSPEPVSGQPSVVPLPRPVTE